MKRTILALVIFLGTLAAQTAPEITATSLFSFNLKQDGISVKLTYAYQSDRIPAKIMWWCDNAGGDVGNKIFATFAWPDGQTYTCRYTHAAEYWPHALTVDARGFAIKAVQKKVKISEPVEIEP